MFVFIKFKCYNFFCKLLYLRVILIEMIFYFFKLEFCCGKSFDYDKVESINKEKN